MARDGVVLADDARVELDELLRGAVGNNLVAVVLFGSTARGDTTPTSDRDVLILVRDEGTREHLVELAQQISHPAVTPLVLTPESLAKEAERRPSFVAHILDEGVALRGTSEWATLSSHLASRVMSQEALEREVANRALALETFKVAERFRNSPATALSHLYSIARSLVIARLLQRGVHEYSWQRAFDRYAEVRPDLSDDILALKALRAYYEYARGRSTVPPSMSIGVKEMRDLVDAIARIAS